MLSKVLLCVAVAMLLEAPRVRAEDEAAGQSACNITFSDDFIQTLEETEKTVFWNCSLEQTVSYVNVTLSDEDVMVVTNWTWSQNDTLADGSITALAIFLGYCDINISLYDDKDNLLATDIVKGSVILKTLNLSTLFTTSLGVLVAIIYVFMGATIDLEIVKGIVKKPIGPLIGIVCQYIGMPLIAFGISETLFEGSPLLQLGMFLSGACPGGGSSNMWTYLFEGSLDLSIMMTFASTVVALGAVPAWVMTLGPVIMANAEFVIPFTDIAVLIVTLVGPCFIGVLIQKFFPRVAKIMEKLLTPISIFNILYTFTFGVYANLFVFKLLSFKILASAFALPALGMVLGAVISMILRMPKEKIIAICIETGIQNATIAQFILFFTLQQPAGSLAFVMPAAYVLMTPPPLMIAYVCKVLYQKTRAYLNSKKKNYAGSEMPVVTKAEPETASPASNGASLGVDNLALEVSEEGNETADQRSSEPNDFSQHFQEDLKL